jgi:hypothetical protein
MSRYFDSPLQVLQVGYVMRLLAQRRVAVCKGRAACVFA